MIPQFGKHSYRPSRWRPKAIAAVFAVCAFITFTRLFRPSFHVFHHTQLYTFDRGPMSPTKFTGQTPTVPESPIPRKVWQNYFGDEIDDASLQDASSWIILNRDYRYTLIGRDGAGSFVNRSFANDPALVRRYHSLPNFGMMSDLLRYMVLYVEGGTYTDIDTTALQPIDHWVAPEQRETVRAIIGLEFDQRDGSPWADISHEVQFCQWTLAAAPGHPLFGRMIARALWSFAELERVHNDTALARLHPTNFEVLNSTGPAAFTDVVFDYLRDNNPGLVTHLRNFSYMTEPKLYGDVLILPIDGFGIGQVHSNSSSGKPPYPANALVKHNFRGGWRTSEKEREEAEKKQLEADERERKDAWKAAAAAAQEASH